MYFIAKSTKQCLYACSIVVVVVIVAVAVVRIFGIFVLAWPDCFFCLYLGWWTTNKNRNSGLAM